MQATRLDLIREFTAEQLRATSRALVSGVESGSNPIVAARNFRDRIGLTTTPRTPLASYRAALEPTRPAAAAPSHPPDTARAQRRPPASQYAPLPAPPPPPHNPTPP